jgi:hypothetical protein
MRDSFIFYRSFFEAIDNLPKENQLNIYKSIAEFSLNQNEIKLVGVERTIWTLIKPQLQSNYNKYLNGAKPKQNGSKTEANDKQNQSKTEANENENDNVNVNEKDIYKITNNVSNAKPEYFKKDGKFLPAFTISLTNKLLLMDNLETIKNYIKATYQVELNDDLSIKAKEKIDTWSTL